MLKTSFFPKLKRITKKYRGVSFLEAENLHRMTNGGNPQGFGGFPLTG